MNLGPCCLPVLQSNISTVAIAVGITQSPHLHAAILYRTKVGIRALDFTLNGDVRDGALSTSQYAWVVPKLHTNPVVNSEWLRQVMNYCKAIGDNPPRFTYSFAFNSRSKIAKHRDKFVIRDARGFTCATFILAVFQHLNLPLLDLDSWSVNVEDTEWQAQMLALVKQNADDWGITKSDIIALEQEFPCVRFSPSMVVGGCRIGNLQADCGRSFEAGKDSVRWLLEAISSHSG